MRSRKPEARSQNNRKASFCFIFWRLAAGFWLLPTAPAFAVSGWFDDTCRRPIAVVWDTEKPTGSEMCQVEFPTGGHVNPDGSDIRISTDEGRQVPAKVLNVGPGDRVSALFSLVKGTKQYYAYFGNPAPPANKPGMDDPKIENGLLLEMHVWTGQPVDNYDQVETAWAKCGPLLGRTMIDTAFYGINPFGPQEQTISKITGSLYAPSDGDYTFAAFADDRGSLYVDGTRILFATLGPADVHIQGKIHLARGRHHFLFYHVNTGNEGRFTIAWKRPDSAVFEVIPRAAFGIFARGNPGVIEQLHKTLIADFTTQYAAECFYADGYSHRYKFAAREPKASNRATYEWDFGDGQIGSGETAEHVYLTDNVYPVKLTVHVGTNVDWMTNRLVVQRDWPQIDKVPADQPSLQSDIVKTYDVARMPEQWLPRATWLHERAGQIEPMLAAADRLAAITKHVSPDQAIAALRDASNAAAAKGNVQDAAKIWDAVSPASDLEPQAAQIFGQLLLWRIGDFSKAVKVLEPYAAVNDPVLKRRYADALVLNQQAAEGRKILDALPVGEDFRHRAAKSGALARTIEYYIETKEWESGEEQWDRWQQQFPADFLEGYSVVLKTKLMELKGANQGAAAVAEAFAKAVPGSSYSPQLLFRAAKLLESTDPTKSQALIKLLKDRYPEDPLSQ